MGRSRGLDGTIVPVAGGGTVNFNLSGITSFQVAHGASFLAFDNVTIDTAPAPEPSILLLLGAGLAGAYARRRI